MLEGKRIHEEIEAEERKVKKDLGDCRREEKAEEEENVYKQKELGDHVR